MEVSSKETLKVSYKKSCHISRYIHQLENLRDQGGLKWSFYVGYMIHLRTIALFSN